VKDLKIPVPKHGLKIAVLTDAQVMPGVPMDHLAWPARTSPRRSPT
jgi:hypothetical protein